MVCTFEFSNYIDKSLKAEEESNAWKLKHCSKKEKKATMIEESKDGGIEMVENFDDPWSTENIDKYFADK